MASTGMKGYFKQQKRKPTISKGTKPSFKLATSKPPKHASVVQPPALVAEGGSVDLKEDLDEKEEVLRQFDMNTAYGPCLGMSRIARWERAMALGLNPPELVEGLIKAGRVRSESLWDGRV